ncbi:hypothetical protein MTR_4g122770 [Medicago truncatula]|uniref:Uncharacterized protein n=1 Tax=Medicago truncatula TaxID=3880 RepID=G7JP04_MEDTR|nr:hypothetical protein MTR_4g122770 [Medicago truncatula]
MVGGAAGGFVTRAFDSMLKECSGKKNSKFVVCCDYDDCLLENKMVLECNSHKSFPQQNGFGVQLTETISFLLIQLCPSFFFTCWKPLSKSNGFGVQLTETISTAKWFWHSGTVIMMNDGIDDEIEDSSGDDDERL